MATLRAQLPGLTSSPDASTTGPAFVRQPRKLHVDHERESNDVGRPPLHRPIRHLLSQPIAQRALQTATRLLSLALGESLRELRSSVDPLMRAHSFGLEHSLLARLLSEVAEILGARWDAPSGPDNASFRQTCAIRVNL